MADTASRKRSLPGDEPQLGFDDPQPKRRALFATEVVFRMVVPSKEIGKVIGKEGHRIQRIREETGATIKIVDPVTRYEDRVIIITSHIDESNVCNAETALHFIARVLLTESDNTGALKSDVGGAVSMIRLLITGCQINCVLGVYGQFLEEVKSCSGAMVMILDRSQLTCLSTQESDQVVQISGEVPQVLTALEKIGSKLRENPPQKVVPTRPICNYTPPTYFNPYNFYHPAATDPYHLVQPTADHVTFEMTIMESLVGGLIGIHGSNISKIRLESGASIKITGMKGENMQRLITFGGNSHQVAVARMLVENYICSQLMRQSRQ